MGGLQFLLVLLAICVLVVLLVVMGREYAAVKDPPPDPEAERARRTEALMALYRATGASVTRAISLRNLRPLLEWPERDVRKVVAFFESDGMVTITRPKETDVASTILNRWFDPERVNLTSRGLQKCEDLALNKNEGSENYAPINVTLGPHGTFVGGDVSADNAIFGSPGATITVRRFADSRAEITEFLLAFEHALEKEPLEPDQSRWATGLLDNARYQVDQQQPSEAILRRAVSGLVEVAQGAAAGAAGSALWIGVLELGRRIGG